MRRTFLQLAGAATAAPTFSRVAMAQVYPLRPITMIVPAPAGGPLDVIGRVLTEAMRGSLGQPIIIENVSGADGSIGTGRALARGPTAIRLISIWRKCAERRFIRFRTTC